MMKCNKGTTVKMNKLEDIAAYLNPWDPVSKNFNTNSKRGAAEISNAFGRGSQVSATGSKQRRGSTVV